MSNKYLIEIGVEEIPARLVSDALKQFKDNTVKMLEESRVGFEEVLSYSTPRRLTLIIKGLEDKQKDLEETQRGPSKKIAFDEEGKPSKALEGFMRGNKVELEDIVLEEYKGEEYVFANILKKGNDTKEVLSNVIPEAIRNIHFPKTMKWGGRDFRFIRPIRWIVSLYNDEVLDFHFENIEISNVTRGHRFLGSDNIVLEDIDSYVEKLEENYVIVDSEERKDIIKIGAEKLARERGGNLEDDEDLLDEITNIVEYPTPIIGSIKDEYLELPDDVIITPMKEHLRYLPVFDDKGRLLPYFITVRNGDSNHIEIVTRGNEKVLGARLEDAKFFYEEDTKIPLEDYVESLKNVMFQDRLGTMYDKTMRLQELGLSICKHLEVGEETEKNVLRAAYLSKADLVTNMVNEFPELQGRMGSEYAMKSNENEIVSLAIEEQYMPRFAGDKVPSITAGMVLSLTDKIDTICGLFAIGIKPTGSQDPFGLRRQAIAIINTILEKKIVLMLSDLIESSLYTYVDKQSLAFDANKVKEEIRNFFNVRIRNVFKDMGIRYDVIDAVVGENIDDVYGMKLKVKQILSWIEGRDIKGVVEAFNRVSNLAEKAVTKEVNEDLLSEDDKKLYNRYRNVKGIVGDFINENKYDRALEELSVLENPIAEFFENVMVMVDEEDIRNNRLAMLKNIDDLMKQLCDMEKIVI